MADDSVGRIAEIRSLGKIGETAHVVRTANDAIEGQITRRSDGVFIDPRTGDTVAVQGPQLPAVLITPNNGSTSDALNAQTARNGSLRPCLTTEKAEERLVTSLKSIFHWKRPTSPTGCVIWANGSA